MAILQALGVSDTSSRPESDGGRSLLCNLSEDELVLHVPISVVLGENGMGLVLAPVRGQPTRTLRAVEGHLCVLVWVSG